MNNLRSLGSTLHVPESDRSGRYAIGSPHLDPAASGSTPADAAPAAPISPPPFVGDGPALWAELHRRALAHQGGKDDTAWLREFALKLPCGHCRVHWHATVHENPPDWKNYFAWSVDRHNEVNAQLGKPGFSQSDAVARWMTPPSHRRRP